MLQAPSTDILLYVDFSGLLFKSKDKREIKKLITILLIFVTGLLILNWVSILVRIKLKSSFLVQRGNQKRMVNLILSTTE